MKKTTLILVLFVLVCTNCSKSISHLDCGEPIDLQLQSNQTFIIGSTGGIGGGGRGIYKIKNGQLFLVLTHGDSLLTNDRFLVANALSKQFPKEMKDAPNKTWRGQCRDTFLYYIEIESPNSPKEGWYFDSCPATSAPDFAQCYFAKVIKTMFTP